MPAGFAGHGGVSVASCHNTQCEAVRRLTQQFGHSFPVCYYPEDDVKFYINWGKNVEQWARSANEILVITSDTGDFGKVQRQEMQFLRDEKLAFEVMTRAEYEARYGGGRLTAQPFDVVTAHVVDTAHDVVKKYSSGGGRELAQADCFPPEGTYYFHNYYAKHYYVEATAERPPPSARGKDYPLLEMLSPWVRPSVWFNIVPPRW